MNSKKSNKATNGRGPTGNGTEDQAAGDSGRLSRNVEALCQIIAGIILRVMAEEETRRAKGEADFNDLGT